eukprot:GHVU01121236.1.p1 GENE.GHVU01121236.1~~GHVU01121236.1.p1  ORF type:complete len:212 (+),score=43.08 GHVU01121236.1:101-736(+)
MSTIKNIFLSVALSMALATANIQTDGASNTKDGNPAMPNFPRQEAYSDDVNRVAKESLSKLSGAMGVDPDKFHVPTMLSFIDGVLKTMPGYAEEGTDPLYQFFDRINAVYDGPDSAEIQEKAIKRSREMMKKQLKTMQDDPRINDATKETFAKATQEILEEMDQGKQPLMNEEEMGSHGKSWKARIEQDIIDAMDEAKQPLMSEEEMRIEL